MEIQLKKELTQVLEDLHWLPLKPVQEKTIPLFLAGRNLLVQAETGAGKTAAYLLPLLQQTEPFRDENRALIIAPTRELAMQIRETADTLSSYLPLHTALLIGGVAPGTQEAELKRRPQIIIGTPGRIVYMIKEGLLDLSSLKVLVIDEADMVVSTGQAEELRMIMQYIDHPVQTVCFSATVSDTVNSFIKDEYESVFLDEAAISHNVSSYYVICEDRYRTLLDILKQQDISAAIIFVKFRSETVSLAEKLQKEGYLAEAFSAYEDEKTRRQALERFRNGRTRLLVATDAASRGIDIRDLSHIIQYQLPQDANTGIHRSGRSGHQGQQGTGIVLIHEEEVTSPVAIDIMADSIPLPPGSSNPNDLSKPLEKEKEPQADVITLRINAGRDDKLRPGDIAGAFSRILPFEKIGRITVNDHDSTVILLEPCDIKELKIKGKIRKIRQL